MRRTAVLISTLLLIAPPLAPSAVAQSKHMKATAPDKMTPPGDGARMRACNAKAEKQKVPMRQKADFVKKCMAQMK